eukprot:15435782-Alexandrium_andersonii.AAC.1
MCSDEAGLLGLGSPKARSDLSSAQAPASELRSAVEVVGVAADALCKVGLGNAAREPGAERE